jgi:AraC family transcriptional activator of pobA
MNKVPIYELYGEDHWELDSDQLHCETIKARSHLYNWNISAHRHKGLYQLLYMRSGAAELKLDETIRKISGPVLVAIPPPTVHGFIFEPAVDGYVIMIPMFVAMRAAQNARQAGLPLDKPVVVEMTGESGRARVLDFLAAQLLREFTAARIGRAQALESLLQLVFLHGARGLEAKRVLMDGHRSDNRVSRFYQLVDRHYTSNRGVADYASDLCISSVHLNKILKETVGKSAQKIIHSRLVLEAKRSLVYTLLNVEQISENLGFADPAYFARFFRRQVGCSPSEFRRSMLEALEVSDTA